MKTEMHGDLVLLSKWAAKIGVKPITVWRWRKKGWLETTNISGRVYVTEGQRAAFNKRAEQGEFAKTHAVPLD